MASLAAPVAPSLDPPVDHSRIRRQAVELEGVFLTTLMKEMFASLGTEDDAFGGGFAAETWRDMQAEQMAAAMADAGGIGLADAIVADLLAVQASQPAIPATPLLHGAYK